MARPIDPNLRIELLAAAQGEFERHGVEATRIDDIVRRAGRSKGAFYQYFASKEDAFRQIVEALLARLSLLIETPLVDEKQDWTASEFFNRWLERDLAIFEFVWHNRDLVRIILGGGFHVGFASMMNTFAKRTYEVIVDGMEFGRQHRIYRRDFETHIVSVLIAGAYDRLARELVDYGNGKPPIRRWVVELQNFVCKGILDR